AIPLYEATLADRERVLGPVHPDTLTSRNDLAAAYHAAGDLTRAIPLYEEAVKECRKVLSPGHPTMAVIEANLKAALESQRRQRGQ
ncbi:MAG TPA: tetratricopeptide repeat protein, partial [Phycicoccus sp.]|nr:tetratricopeptide repeat protein [Phycicoccus sp.]